MTDNELIQVAAGMVGAKGEDETKVAAYLTLAKQKILNRLYPFRDDVDVVPPKYHALQCEIAAYLYNKQGAEGQLTHSENGVSRSYENGDVPESLMRQITPYGRVY